MNCVLSDTKRFKQVNYDNNIHNLDKFQKCLYYLKQKGSLEQEIYGRIRPSAAVTPTLQYMDCQKFIKRTVLAAQFWLQLTATLMSAHHGSVKF